ncbi:hypothetical protein E6P09_07015 [Haloferax mediterranei ATCC 33500]|uniref:DUF5518 domain-containing protein n=1 Tax=Haloferax mediterranei (strain ATCC 33500 / DSM 1411 / JCM 8866 / NBRC 14739 / NCIMB 2177 / R-4) TaxID=523841 RepID=M0IZA5_HALMT|nr:DUF5518 domain-containing protein [Haloferax mediterranei]AHZ22100.1 hypothetical protein BM92_05255 [Haloferax mediterranei ATCC 33500]EMA02207.1 hypothetical protein C439_06490 [Haloferax mediterranei ATCC 33500]MDX5988608.1 DUF5518 domain-containing protein [Haloferax mediterranei ATCC 33500]QCQ75024.1 hypothetical protein E6P09_07015 [Haloferax mediterranei ATCC 33500]
MSLQSLHSTLTDHPWAYALPVGGVCAWYVFVTSWQSSPGSLPLGPVLLASFVGGFLFEHGSGDASGVGFRTGIVGALPLVWHSHRVFPYIAGLDQPAWFGVVQAMLILFVTVVIVVFAGAFGMLGAFVGSWVATKTSRRGPAVTGE